MPKRYLIADQKEIEVLKKQFELISKDIKYWTETYLNNKTGEKWLYYRIDSSFHGGGYPVLGLIPIPDSNKLIDIALNSNFEDEVFAACRTLVENEEIKKEDFRLRLLEQLEMINNRRKQKRIIELAGLNSPLNRRKIVGRSFDEVSFDSQYFKAIADRAEKLFRQ